MRKKIISSILTALLFINVIMPNTVGASSVEQATANENNSQLLTENLLDAKNNFNFIKSSDISDIQYTYEDNGKVYYVYESANADLTKINTKIYEVGIDSKFLVDKYTTYIEKSDDALTVTRYSNGVSVDSTNIDIKDGSLELDSIKPAPEESTNVNSEVSSINSVSDDRYSGYINYDGRYNKYYTTWFYEYDFNGSNLILKFSYTVIIGILSGITGNPYIVGGITSAAQFILDHAIPDVYWHKDIYHVYQITYPDLNYYGSFIGERTYTNFYSDSNRSSMIGSDLYEWHDPNEWPSIVIH